MAGASLTVRVDPKVKAEAEKIYSDLGMSLSTAVNVFLRRSVWEGGLPFELNHEQPSAELLEAAEEARRMASDPGTPRYKTADEALKAAGVL